MNRFLLLACFMAAFAQVLEPTLAADEAKWTRADNPMDMSKMMPVVELAKTCWKELMTTFPEIVTSFTSAQMDLSKMSELITKAPDSCKKFAKAAMSFLPMICKGSGGLMKMMGKNKTRQ